MTQEEKQLLIKDLCARLPYGVIVNFTLGDISFNERVSSVFVDERSVQVYVKHGFLKCPLDGDSEIKLSQVKPYLRPLSSMTEKENEELKYVIELELQALEGEEGHNTVGAAPAAFEVDFYNKHHFDYRGLIEKGLALEAEDGMYKTE